MIESISDRHKAENEVVLRQQNEKIQKQLDEVNAMAAEDGVKGIDFDSSLPIHFFCECSDENCRERIKITLNDYNEIHTVREHFIVLPGHEVPKIEDVTSK